MGAYRVLCRIDYQVMVDQVKGEFEVKETILQKYYHLVSNLISKFDSVNIKHIRRENNVRVEVLSRLATKKGIHLSIIYVVLKNPSARSESA